MRYGRKKGNLKLEASAYELDEEMTEGKVVTVFVYDETERIVLEVEMSFVDQPCPKSVVLESPQAENERIIQYEFRLEGDDDFGQSCSGFFANIALPNFIDGLTRAKIRTPAVNSPVPETRVSAGNVKQ